jgi:hypothetical protein
MINNNVLYDSVQLVVPDEGKVWIVCGSSCGNGATVRMADKNDAATLPAQHSFQGSDIIAERSQRDLC